MPEIEIGLFQHTRDLVEIHEVAVALRCSEQHIRDLVDEGLIIAVPIGDSGETKRTHLRIKRASVEAFVMEREAQHSGINMPYRQSAEVQWWRGELQKRRANAHSTRGR